MKLLMVRHGKAGEREEWLKTHQSDDERPLISEGVEEFMKVAQALATILDSIDTIYASPLKRTKQTADLLHKSFPSAKVENDDVLLQGTHWKEFHTFLLKQKWGKDQMISIVGHENQLSHILSNLISCSHEESVRFKKGGVALVDLELMEAKVTGKLLWFFGPKTLMKLHTSK